MNNNKLAYLVITYNGSDSIGLLLRSIPSLVDTVVIDNASTDATISVIQQYPVQLIRNTENIGYGAAINQGILLLKDTYEYVFVLNQDIEIQNFTFDESIVQQYCITQPLILLPNGTINVDELRMNVLGYVYPKNFGLKQPLSQQKEIFFFSGAAFILNVSLFLQHKIGFDERLFLYYEDVDVAFRIFLAGQTNLHYPQWTVIHYCHTSFLTPSKKKMLSQHRSIIANRYFTNFWRIGALIQKTNDADAYLSEQKTRILQRLRRELLLGFYTKQLSFLVRCSVNIVLVPYAWFVWLFL